MELNSALRKLRRCIAVRAETAQAEAKRIGAVRIQREQATDIGFMSEKGG